MDGSSPSTTGPPPNPDGKTPLRYYNLAVIGLDLLYEAAIHGSSAATEKLRALSDALMDAVARYGPN